MTPASAQAAVARDILLACNSRGRLLDLCLEFPQVRGRIWGIVSDRSSESLSVATRHGLNELVLDEKDDEKLSDQLLERCERHAIRSIVSTGYTRIFKGRLIDAYRGQLLNSHFSILPAFPGRRNSDWTTTKLPPKAIFERTLAFGARITGNTIHLIDHTIDGGSPVMQSSLIIPYGEDPRHTRHRLFVQECQCLMQMIMWISQDRLVLRDRASPEILDAKFDSPSFSPALEEPWIIDFDTPNRA